MQPLISVIVPAYNIAPYLSRCLDSILNQSYQNIEVIVVDDGSTDCTGKIADEYAHRYSECVKCIHLKNGGVTKARLIGTTFATGEWVGYVDGDDVIEEDMYRRLMDNALKYQSDISHCGYQTIVNGGERVHYFYNTGRLVRQDRTAGLKDLLSGAFVEPGLCNKLFHRKLFDNMLQNNLMDDSLRINEDLMMNFILFSEAESAIYEDFCPYHYMTRSTSATRQQFNIRKVLDPLKVREWILERVDLELKDIAWNKYLICCCNAYIVLYKQNNMCGIANEIKQILSKNRDKWQYLSKKEQIKLRWILYLPGIYCATYRVYEKYFQRKIYE